MKKIGIRRHSVLSMQTKESLARLRLLIAVFRVEDGLVHDRTLLTAVAKHLIHE